MSSYSPLSPISGDPSSPSHSHSHSPHSREITPSSIISNHTASSQHAHVVDMADSEHIDTSDSSQSQEQEQDGKDRFIKRMEMEKTLQALQSRLELASLKASNGWTDMSIGEIEQKLPPSPARKRPIAVDVHAASSQMALPYQPPSPSRPWQLIDVLWQPLPPPRSPLSRKRSRDDDGRATSGHRRASSSTLASVLQRESEAFGSGSGSGYSAANRIRKEKRSQSHSVHNIHPSRPSISDVDAANALTSMLGTSGPVRSAHSLPIPKSPIRKRSQSLNPSPDRSKSSPVRKRDTVTPSREDEDQDAAELMMYLAHSPSPAAKFSPTFASTSRANPSSARVLFADDPPKGQGPVGKSNLAVAAPIMANGSRGDPPKEEDFGSWLG